MKRIYFIIVLASFYFISGCNDKTLDFTKVENPNLYEEVFLGEKNSSIMLLNGMKRQFSATLNELVPNAEIASDNYYNIRSDYNTYFDELIMNDIDKNIYTMQLEIAKLRELAIYGIDRLGPADPDYKKSTKADYLYYKGLSYLYAGMYFKHLPQEKSGVPKSSKENFEAAVKEFKKALSINKKPKYNLILARTYYYLGNKEEAVKYAKLLISEDPYFLQPALYDNQMRNEMSAVLKIRSANDLQPLPPLDFLDPKFLTISDTFYYLKAEEAYLILAEANTSNLTEYKKQLNALLDVVSKRKVHSITDNDDRENLTNVMKKADKNINYKVDDSGIKVNNKENLVLARREKVKTGKKDKKGNDVYTYKLLRVKVPATSGTSLKKDIINNVNDEKTALKVLYKTRQEIFIAEGLRMVDMGVKFILSEIEITRNPNAKGVDNSPQIPPFIKRVRKDLDAFTYNKNTKNISLKVDVTNLLVENKGSKLVLPFH